MVESDEIKFLMIIAREKDSFSLNTFEYIICLFLDTFDYLLLCKFCFVQLQKDCIR